MEAVSTFGRPSTRWNFPARTPTLRAELEEELRILGPASLHARLAERDPAAASAILPGNGRRIVRALEVVALTGSFSAQMPAHCAVYDVTFVGVDRPDLDIRIAERTRRMWEAGFVDEVRTLAKAGLREGRTAPRALGYAQVLAWLDGDLADEAAAAAETVRLTRKFVRRQRSWFRRDPRIQWLPPVQSDDPVVAADAAEALIAAAADR